MRFHGNYNVSDSNFINNSKVIISCLNEVDREISLVNLVGFTLVVVENNSAANKKNMTKTYCNKLLNYRFRQMSINRDRLKSIIYTVDILKNLEIITLNNGYVRLLSDGYKLNDIHRNLIDALMDLEGGEGLWR